MNLTRRTLCVTGALLGSGLSLPLTASAQTAAGYPGGPIKIIVPFAPGGIVDSMARLLGDQMATALKQSVFIENRPGASGSLGPAALKKAAPDGLTLMFATNALELFNPHMFKKLPYEGKDLERITVIYDSSIALVVPKSIKVTNIKELAAYAKTRPQGLTYGSWGNGSAGHLFGELLKGTLGVNMAHVPYKGEIPALTDMVRGDLDLTWASPNGARTFIEQGNSVVVGVTGNSRSPGLPQVATFTEQGISAFNLGLYGVAYAPAGTPRPIVEKLQQVIRDIVHRPEVRERFATMGMVPVGSTTAEFNKLFEQDRPVWQRLIQASGATLD